MAPLLCRGSDHGASVSNQRAFAGGPAAGLTALGPASAGSECRSRGCPQSPPARTSRRLAGCNSRTWPLRRSPSVHTKASRRLRDGPRDMAAATAVATSSRPGERRGFPPEPNEAPKKMALLKELHNLASFCQNYNLKLRLAKPRNQYDLRLACRQDLAPSKTQSLTLGIIVSSSSAKPLISAPRSSWRLPTGRVFTQLQPHLEELQTIVSPAGLGAYASTASTDLHLHIISKFIQVRSRLELAPRRRLGSQTCAATMHVVRSDP